MHKIFASLALCLTLGGMMVAAAPAARAQTATEWPKQPVRLVVPYAPGGPVDIIARMLAPKLNEILGQSMVVENRAGAGGNIGAVFVARSAPDGYNVMVASSALAVNVTLFANPGYDIGRDFTPVAFAASQPNMLVVNAAVPVKNIAELVAYAKGRKLAFAAPDIGSTPYLTGANMYNLQLKLNMTAIHYMGAGPAVAAVLAGEPAFGSMALAAPMPLIKAGKLRGIGVSSAKRSPFLPEVPTFGEQGYPAIQDYTWVGFFMPAATPPAIVAKFNEAVNQALQAPEVKAHLALQAIEPAGGTPKEFGDYVKAEVVKWGKVVKETGARPE